MATNHLSPAALASATLGPGTGYGLGVSGADEPGQKGNVGSVGEFGWSGAASTHVLIDPKEDLVAIYCTQLMGGDFAIRAEFATLLYQSDRRQLSDRSAGILAAGRRRVWYSPAPPTTARPTSSRALQRRDGSSWIACLARPGSGLGHEGIFAMPCGQRLFIAGGIADRDDPASVDGAAAANSSGALVARPHRDGALRWHVSSRLRHERPALVRHARLRCRRDGCHQRHARVRRLRLGGRNTGHAALRSVHGPAEIARRVSAETRFTN
jgi:hypothetical protein